VNHLKRFVRPTVIARTVPDCPYPTGPKLKLVDETKEVPVPFAGTVPLVVKKTVDPAGTFVVGAFMTTGIELK
jgi:hypothetical protein